MPTAEFTFQTDLDLRCDRSVLATFNSNWLHRPSEQRGGGGVSERETNSFFPSAASCPLHVFDESLWKWRPGVKSLWKQTLFTESRGPFADVKPGSSFKSITSSSVVSWPLLTIIKKNDWDDYLILPLSILKVQCVVSLEEIQTQNLNIYNINELVTQTRFRWCINELFSEQNKIPEQSCLKLERWQGPPHVNKAVVSVYSVVKTKRVCLSSLFRQK